MTDKLFPRAAGAPWYQVRAARQVQAADGSTSTVVDIWIYDVIGDDWYDPSLTAKEFCQMLAGLEAQEIVLHMSSPGGSVADGIAIYNALMAHPAKITARVEGWTCSIATVIALAADQVVMYDNVFFMIHNPWGFAGGNAEAMREYADFLDMVAATLTNVYMTRCTKTDVELQAAMDAETFFTAAQAMEWGFVDEVIVGAKAAARARFDVKAFGYKPPAGAELAAVQAEGKRNSDADVATIEAAIALLQGLLADEEAEPPEPGEEGGAAALADGADVTGDAPATIEARNELAAQIASAHWL